MALAYRAALARHSAGRSLAVQQALHQRQAAQRQAAQPLAHGPAQGAATGTASTDPKAAVQQASASLLAGLLQHVDQRATALAAAGMDPVTDVDDSGLPADSAAPRELRALRLAGPAWAQLRVQQQVQQSLAQAPGQAGPLNSHGLVLRSLQTLQRLSPAYLLRFMAQMETLFELDTVQAPGPRGDRPAPKPAARARRL